MAPALGIDLGTTNSVGCFQFADPEVVVADGNTPPERKLTPSVVAWHEGRFQVGEGAVNRLRAEPERVVASVKRLMGRGLEEAPVQAYLRKFARTDVVPAEHGTGNSLGIRLGARTFSPEDVSAEILRQVLASAEEHLRRQGRGGGEIRQAVITVPAYFNDKQRNATRVAGLRAGLQHVELLPEPTAAAISYGHSSLGGEVKTVLVYDFGGGTFDVSLIMCAERQFIEQAKAGDAWLGGDDIDRELVRRVKAAAAAAEGLDDVDALIARMPTYQRLAFEADLRRAVEQAKIALSASERTMVIPSTPLLDEMGMAVNIEVPLHRADLEALVEPLVNRTVAICRDAIEEAGFSPDMIDLFLLVGGSSQIPLVQRKMREAFGEKVIAHPRPMYAVAEGAAVVAAGLVEKVGSVSRDYFLRLVDEPRHLLIPRNETLPVKIVRTFRTEVDGQRMIHMAFFNHDHVSGVDESIGDLWLTLDRHHPKGTPVLATLELDETTNVLQVTACLQHDPAVRVSRSFSRGGADEAAFREIEGMVEAMKGKDLTAYGVEQGLQRSAEAVQAANLLLDEQTGREVPEARARLEGKLGELRTLLSGKDDHARWLGRQCEQVLEVCPFLLKGDQRARLKGVRDRLEDARKGDEAQLEESIGAAERELEALPQATQLVRMSLEAVHRAHQTSPVEGQALGDQVARMIDAMGRGDGAEADRLWKQLQPQLLRWLEQALPTGATIATGLTR